MPAEGAPTPYVGFRPFTAADQQFFFGRETERRIVAANLTAARLTVLYGASGVGKSSVLGGAVLPDLVAASRHRADQPLRHGAVYFREWSDWRADALQGITQAVHQSLARDYGVELAGNGAPDFGGTLDAWMRSQPGPLLLILDQFEEYLLYREGDPADDDFSRELARVLDDRDLRVNVLIGIRDDALAGLDRFKGRIPQLFDNRLELKRLSRRNAQVAIEAPLRKLAEYGVKPARIEDGLVTAVLDQVAVGRVRLGALGEGGVRDSGRVAPAERPVEAPYLQLVMHRLWSDAHTGGDDTLRLAAFDGPERAKQILQEHVDTRMARLGPDQDVAAEMFRYLVTPSGAKIALSAFDLAEQTRLPEGTLAPVLDKLSEGEARILRPVSDAGVGSRERRFEIFHDALARAVLDWVGRWKRQADENRVREAQAQLRTERLLKWRARAVALVFAAGVVLLLGVFYLNQRRAVTESRARRLALEAADMLRDDPEVSLAMALRAAGLTWQRYDTVLPEVQAVLHRILPALRERMVLEGHGTEVLGMAVSPGGGLLATSDNAGVIRLWDAESGEYLRDLAGHRGVIRRIAFAPFGDLLVSAGADSTVRLWNLRDSSQSRVLGTHRGAVGAVAFDPTGTQVLSGSTDGTARLWDVGTGTVVRTFDHGGSVTGVAFASYGGLAVTAAEDAVGHVWDLGTGDQQCTFTGHREEIYAAGVSSSWPETVVTGGRDMAIGLWDPQGCLERRRIVGHANSVFDLALSPAGAFLATGGADATARVWDLGTGQEVLLLAGHRQPVFGLQFSPDGERLFTASWDSTVRVWDVERSRSEVEVLQPQASTSQIRAVAFNPTRPQLAAIDLEGWSLMVSHLERPLLSYTRPVGGTPVALAYAPDGSRLAVGGASVVSVLNAETGDLQAQLPRDSLAPLGEVSALAYAPDGSRLALGGVDGAIALWRLADSVVTVIGATTGRVNGLAFDGTGTRLASGSDDGAFVWTLSGDSAVATDTLRGHVRRVVGLAISPDDRLVATAGDDHLVRLFALETGEALRSFEAGNNTVWSLAFDRDGRRLASASFDGTARIWDLESGRQGLRLSGHDGRAFGVAFSPDGRLLATSGDDGAVRVWILRADALLAKAWSHVHRVPTAEECRRLFQDDCPAALAEVAEGRRLARLGQLADATARFARARELDPTFRMDPDSLARSLAVTVWIGRGLALLRQDRTFEAMDQFRKAAEQDRARIEGLVGEIVSGISTLLQTGDTAVVGPALDVYREATTWDPTFVPTADALNALCWWGSLGGRAGDVAAYCEAAVRASPDGYIVESRGVNRALRGDRAGAIEDFTVFVKWTQVAEDRARRQRWIRILRQGGDPITPSEIAALRRE